MSREEVEFERGQGGELRGSVRTGQPTKVVAPSWKSLPGNFDTWSAEQKIDYMWNERICKTRYRELPPLIAMDWASMLGSFNAVSQLGLTFSHSSDELPRNRAKIIHGFGTTARVRFEATASRYTGIFRGARGLARLSVAAAPAAIGFTPGMGLKFPISHCKEPSSVNIVVMNSVNGQGADTNFFARPFSNLIPAARGLMLKAVEALFQTVRKQSGFLPVKHLATWEQSGQRVTPPVHPHHIVCKPAPAAQSLISSSSTVDFRDDLASIAPGTCLYQVEAVDEPRKGAPGTPIGHLVTETEFVASWWGDKRMFFQHIG